MIKTSVMLIAGICVIMLSAVPAIAVTAGENAPNFEVKSGDDEILKLDMLKGRLAVIFYETKDTTETNRHLKDELNRFYTSQPPEEQKNIMRIAIVRCPSFLSFVWRNVLRANSKKEGIVIYGDWDGSMEDGYGMVAGESNFLIVDKSGVVRYVRAGLIPENDFPAIKRILDELK